MSMDPKTPPNSNPDAAVPANTSLYPNSLVYKYGSHMYTKYRVTFRHSIHTQISANPGLNHNSRHESGGEEVGEEGFEVSAVVDGEESSDLSVGDSISTAAVLAGLS